MAFVIIDGVKTTLAIDSAGRVVLPKPLRQRFRLRTGSTLRLEVHGDAILLRPTSSAPPPITETGGLLVHEGRADDTLADWILRDREQRDVDVAGTPA